MIKIKIFVILSRSPIVSQHIAKYSPSSVQDHVDQGAIFPSMTTPSLKVSRFHVPCSVGICIFKCPGRLVS